MACEDWDSSYWLEAAKSNEYIEWIWCPLADQTGAPVAGLLIYGGISIYLYTRTGSVVLPAQLAIIFGSAALAWVAATAVSMAVAAVLFLLSIIAVLVIRRIAR